MLISPQAVMMSHDNVTFTALSITEALHMRDDTIIISYLPLRSRTMGG